MDDEIAKNRILPERRVKEELDEIWADYPGVERNGLVEWHIWMKILREKQQPEKSDE